MEPGVACTHGSLNSGLTVHEKCSVISVSKSNGKFSFVCLMEKGSLASTLLVSSYAIRDQTIKHIRNIKVAQNTPV